MRLSSVSLIMVTKYIMSVFSLAAFNLLTMMCLGINLFGVP